MPTYRPSWLKLPSSRLVASGVLALALAGAAAATTILDVRDGATATAKISLKEPTRVRCEGGRITDLFGSSVRTPDNPAGGLIVQPDRAKGELYLQPTEGMARNRATSVFVSTEQATYTLLLIPLDIPADTVVLRDRAVSVNGQAGSASSRTVYKAPSHFRDLKRLLRAMASDAVPADISVQETATPMPLWAEAHFVLTRTYDTGGRWRGQFFQLTNISTAPMVLDEREFYDGEDVAVIAVDPPELAPGQTASVLVVREVRP